MHLAVDALHHVERRAGDGVVVAGGEHARHAHAACLERAQQERLAQHVVRRRRQRRARRTAQHPFAAVAADHVGDVGVPVADRLGLQRARCRARARRGRPPADGGSAAADGRAPRPLRGVHDGGQTGVDRKLSIRTATSGWDGALESVSRHSPFSAGSHLPLMRRLLPILPLLAALRWPAIAPASPRQTVTFEAPRELLSASTREATLDQINGFGVTQIRQLVYWRDYAPEPDSKTRPNFDASDPERVSGGQVGQPRRADRRRQGARHPVTLTLTGPVPHWATRDKKDNLTYPDPKEFGAFATAMGRRYGDAVSTWSVWNEPNQPHSSSRSTRRQAVLAEALPQALPGGVRRPALDAGQRRRHDPDRRDLAARQRATSSARSRSCAGCSAWTPSTARPKSACGELDAAIRD